MEVNIEHKDFINERCKSIFEKENNINIDSADYHLEISLLNGLSNKFYHVRLVSEKHSSLKIKDLCFKFFGAGSHLVDRDLELLIMDCLNLQDYGPKVYETDKNTYRIEEFLENCTTLSVNDKHLELVNDELKKSFIFYNTAGDYASYKFLLGKSKKESFEYLLNEDTKQNIINFTVKKIGGLSKKVLPQFAEKMRSDDRFSKDEVLMYKLTKVEEYLERLEEIMFDALPEKFILNLAHNDSHFLNVLVKGGFEKVLLIDHEYCCFNLAGVDIANYNMENLYFLGKEVWPFYDFFYNKNYLILNEEIYTKRFENYVDSYVEKMGREYADVKEFDEVVKYMKTKDYYWRCISFSVMLWYVWALNYLNYDEYVNQSNFNYFEFAYDRAQGYFVGKQFFDSQTK